MALPRSSRSKAALRFALAAPLLLTAGAVCAEGRYVDGYGPAYGYGPVEGYRSGYGFADEAVRGSYVGAPFSSVPSPNRIVPAPWSYGTYGVPTISGIREAPVAAPSLTVVNARPSPAQRRASGPRILSRERDGAWTSEAGARAGNGVNVITVSVPRR